MRSLSTVRVGAEVAPALPMQPSRLREANRFPGTHSWEAREHFIPDCALTRHGAPRLPGRVTAGAGAGPGLDPGHPRWLGHSQDRESRLLRGTNPSFLPSLFPRGRHARGPVFLDLSFGACHISMLPGRPGRVFIPFRDFSAHPSPPSALRASLSYSLPAPGRKAERRGGR